MKFLNGPFDKKLNLLHRIKENQWGLFYIILFVTSNNITSKVPQQLLLIGNSTSPVFEVKIETVIIKFLINHLTPLISFYTSRSF